jgi:3'-5' exoribonuclease
MEAELNYDTQNISQLKQACAAGNCLASVRAQVESVQTKPTKQGGTFLEIKLVDGQDSLVLRVWADAPQHAAAKQLQPRSFVAIQGDWSLNQYGLDPKNWTIRALSPEESVLLLAGHDSLKLKQENDYRDIEKLCASILDPRLHGLCQMFLAEFGERFKRTAAAREYHHARRGGLVEHVAQMMRSAAALCTVYTEANRDLLITGVLFHDCGKLWENCYPAEGFSMPYSEPGEMLGHITLGIELVNKLWRKLLDTDEAEPWMRIEPTSETVRLHLLHLIGSHHGEYAFGSPVLPKTPEAILLHHIDNIDAKWEMFSKAYATSATLGKNILERQRPLPANVIRPLLKFVPDEIPAPSPESEANSGEAGN